MEMEVMATFKRIDGTAVSVVADDKITSVCGHTGEGLPDRVVIVRDGLHFMVLGTHDEVVAKLKAARQG